MRRTYRLLAACASLYALAPVAAFAQSTSTTATVVDPGTLGGFTGPAATFDISDDFSSASGTRTNYSKAYGVSGDGITLFGTSVQSSGTAHAFTWTAARGFVDLGTLGGASVAMGSSADGAVVAGTSRLSPTGIWHAFRWTASGGMVDLGSLGTNQARNYSVGTGASADGSVIVGGSWTDTTIDRAFRWTAATGMVNLGTIGNAGDYSDALGVSADGNVVVGLSFNTTRRAFRWTAATGMVDLGNIGSTRGDAVATAANADGAVVVGKSIIGTGPDSHAFRWTASGGMADLGTIGGVAGNSTAFGVNGDGSVVVGSSVFANGNAATHAMVWTAANGAQDLNVLLSNAGVNMTGVNLIVARGVSSNGQFFAGSGFFPGAPTDEHAYLARIGGSSAGVTTSASVRASIALLAESRRTQMITQGVLASVLTGRNEQVNCGGCIGGYISFGSVTGGAHGRHSLTDAVTLIGGVSYGEYSERGASISSSFTLAAALRIDPAHMGSSRPFAEIGGVVSPNQASDYARTYVNGAGTTTGRGSTRSTNYSVHATLGWVTRLSPIDEIAATLQATQSWQRVDGYAEATGAANPFEAAFADGTDKMTILSANAQFTHLFGRRLEFNLNGGVSRSIQSSSGIAAVVAGVGGVGAAPPPGLAWFETGGRLGYRLNPRITIDAFINAVLGPAAIGSSAHGGLGFRVSL